MIVGALATVYGVWLFYAAKLSTCCWHDPLRAGTLVYFKRAGSAGSACSPPSRP